MKGGHQMNIKGIRRLQVNIVDTILKSIPNKRAI